jgi:hypothetical protein
MSALADALALAVTVRSASREETINESARADALAVTTIGVSRDDAEALDEADDWADTSMSAMLRLPAIQRAGSPQAAGPGLLQDVAEARIRPQ